MRKVKSIIKIVLIALLLVIVGSNKNVKALEISNHQKPKENAFCIQEEKGIKAGTYKKSDDLYYDTNNSDKYKYMFAYIYNADDEYIYPGGGLDDNGSGALEATFNNRQEAVWAAIAAIRGKYDGYTSKGWGDTYFNYRRVNYKYDSSSKKYVLDNWQGGLPGRTDDKAPFVSLYIEAYNYYREAKNATASVKTENGNVQKVLSNGDFVVGPYKVTYTSVTGKTASVTLDSSLSGKAYISDINGTAKSITSGSNFYITIKSNSLSSLSGKNITLKYNINLDVCKGVYYWAKLINGEYTTAYSGQKLIWLDVGTEPKTSNVTITIPTLVPKLSIKLNKINDLNEALTGAKFDISFKQGSSNLGSKTDISEGVEVTSNQPANTNNITVTIKETKAPSGYCSFGTQELTFEYKNNQWQLKTTAGTTNARFTQGTVDTSNRTLTKITVNAKDNVLIKNLILKKVNTERNAIAGAKFTVNLTNATILNPKETYTTDANGNINIGAIRVEDLTKAVTVTLTETDAPAGYSKLDGPFEFKLEYNNNLGIKQWTRSITKYPTLEGSVAEVKDMFEVKISNGKLGQDTTVDVQLPDLSKVDELTLEKVDQNNNIITGAEFEIQGITNCINESSLKSKTYKTDTDGILKIENIIAKKTNEDIVVTLKETKAPAGYALLEENIVVTFKFNGTKWIAQDNANTSEAIKSVENSSDASSKATVSVIDLAQIDDLSLEKINSVYDIKVAGAKFKATVTSGNAKFKETNSEEIEKTTGSNGKLDFKEIIITQLGQDNITTIGLKLEEIEVPQGYKKLDPIELIITRKGTNNNITYTIEKDFSGNETIDVTENNHRISINAENIPIMNLGGMVWLDKFNGDYKTGATRSGTYNSGEELEGIYVHLYANDGLVRKNAKGEDLVNPVVTDENGRYVFEGIEVGEYVVYFEYEGVKYITVPKSGESGFADSVAIEVGRDEFNSNFEEISGVSANSETTKGTTNEGITLTYENGEDTAILTETSDHSTYSTKSMFAKYSHDYRQDDPSVWLNTWKNWSKTDATGDVNWGGSPALRINCGLQERLFDLSLYTDVDYADVSINGKTTRYNYDEMLDKTYEYAIKYAKEHGINTDSPEFNQLLKGIIRFYIGDEKSDSTLPEIIYNLCLYTSDYNYRINDYIDSLPSYLRDTYNYEDGSDVNGDVDRKNTENTDELQIDVTYKVVLTNQSILEQNNTDTSCDTYVTKVKDYFDSTYTLKNVQIASQKNTEKDISSDEIKTLPTSSWNITDSSLSGYNAVEINIPKTEEYNLGGTTNGDDLTNVVLYLTFTVNKEDDLNGGEQIILGQKGNIAGIESYSTENGLIDIDSAPGNCVVNDGTFRYEDDTDDAEKLDVKLKDEAIREISGVVFNAGENGSREVRVPKVNDVIVQLIEIKTIGEDEYEYIWQQTRTTDDGTQEVQVMDDKGSGIWEYTNTVEEGQYIFKNFIPGDYIVRFIYGDGRTYDLYTDPDVQQYNGQDYKSTYYASYNHENYYNVDDTYNKNISVARDNEARRLEVMEYSVEVNNEIGTAVKDKTKDMLNRTWMCAETLKINVPVDADNLATDSSSENVANGYENSGEGMNFNQINFGLQLRPKTVIELEKHITALSVNTSSGQILLDASADIDDILQDNVIDTKNGVTKGLTTIVSERGNRGFWKLETDLSELGQGSELNAEYTYVVKNVGGIDYLNEDVVSSYRNDITDDYKNNLLSYSDVIKGSLYVGENSITDRYLGEYYYTGSVGTDDDIVPTKIDELQEALNNQVSFVATGSSFERVDDNDDMGAYVNALSDETPGNTIDDNKYHRTIWRDLGPTGVPESGINPVKEKMNNIIKTTSGTSALTPGNNDTSKIAKVQSTITTEGGSYDSYIAEIISYTNAAGRVDMNIAPENLTYVHSDDTTRTLEALGDTGLTYPDEAINEHDEFWGESIIISKPTGEDQLTPVQIIAICTAGVAIIGVGIILIKKFVIKK